MQKHKNAATVEEYLKDFPQDVQWRLNRIREIILNTVPEVQEKISWGAPSYYAGAYLMQIAGYENHIGFYTCPETLAAFREELTPFRTNTKNTVQFPHDKELPFELIEQMVKFRAGLLREKTGR